MNSSDHRRGCSIVYCRGKVIETRRLSPLQRAYLLGFRRGVRWAWNRMVGKAQTWEDEIATLQADYEELVSELRQSRDEEAIRQALVERAMHPGGRLN